MGPSRTESVGAAPGPGGPTDAGDAPVVDHARLFRAVTTPYLVMTPGFVILDVNDAYLSTVGRPREDLVGRTLIEAFPPTTDALGPSGISPVQESLEAARRSGRPDVMPIQKYDIPDPANGGVVERYWSLTSIPVLDDAGRTALLVQRAEDITDLVLEHGPRALDAEWRRRIGAVEADLFARVHDLARALEAKELAARRLSALAEAALLLTTAGSVADLERIVVERGLRVLGADGGMLVSARADGGWRLSATSTHPGDDPVTDSYLPPGSAHPPVQVARSGRPLLLPTRAAGLAFDASMAEAYERTGVVGTAFLPLTVNDRTTGVLGVGWAEEHHVSPDELELLEAFAAQLAQALERIRATEAQERAAAESQRLSEALQRSLLTQPPRPPGLSIAVRYQPAAQEARVGGDWYDAFVTASGATVVVVGDVMGHDRAAAAAMGQLRNMLRGIAFDSHGTPAVHLRRLDAAIHGLELDTMATAVLARLEQSPADSEAGLWQMRWSSAGHLAPVIRTPDGEVHLIDGRSDLLLGVDPTAPRTDRALGLTPGTTLVLYTDGLVERRRRALDQGVERLLRVVRGVEDDCPETLADAILAELGPDSRDDDLALLVLTVDR